MPYCKALFRSIVRSISTTPDSFGTTTREDDALFERGVAGGRAVGGSTGLLGVGVKRFGKATEASRVSYGKFP